MSSITSELAAVLATVRRPGDFFASGAIEFLAPQLEVEGVGQIALPLLSTQAKQLIAAAERAPYGRGEQTLVDTAIRRTWQIGPDQVRIQGRGWARTLSAILARVCDGLGVTEPVQAEFYKLLIYDEGSFFASHRDTEKAPGMFATLVVVLPSPSAGGELVVRHKDREVRLDLHCPDPSEVAFGAFYADCVHEVLPVTSGVRLALIYNLLRPEPGRLPEPPSYASQQTRLATLLQAWGAELSRSTTDAPEKLIFPLEHAYTSAQLGFGALKGADAAAAAVLRAAAQAADCDLHLALISVQESGSAEYTGYGSSYRRWSEPDEDEFEEVEVLDRYIALSTWRRPDGQPSVLGVIPVGDDELCPPDALEELEPDEEHFHEATGNEGASFERTYRRATLVLWPRQRFFAVLCQAGVAVTLPYLADLTERWLSSDEDHTSPLWGEAHELSGHMISSWHGQDGYPSREKAPTHATQMLILLIQLRNKSRLEAFLTTIAAGSGVYAEGDNDAIVQALGLMSPQRAAALTQQIITGNATTSLTACGNLLARLVASGEHGRGGDLRGAATALVEALPGDPQRAPAQGPWWQDQSLKPRLVIDLLEALCWIDPRLADDAAGYMLTWPQTYSLDTVLIPAMRTLVQSSIAREPPVQRLRDACLDHLRARIARPLVAPSNWSRATVLPCQCRHCTELSRFLADPEQTTWAFKAVEADRSHVEQTIQRAHCDVDITTDRRGRPYTLVCTKNHASYDRRAKQRRKDLEDVIHLGGGDVS
ncbi:2OG-Fe(II) oxygenase [Microvirga aerilata]|uniref:2OG-Fe(II) oxygenase n=1 Tax=Microvirga aerilata TaxID=670292 RepID=A0A937D522_9HYPH|nr:2OG-Fe(II) oxygenase [Microvirga aerilata]MBL0408180.1 2OG-Fe(II) oxygenase [Microvirga aerilata]